MQYGNAIFILIMVASGLAVITALFFAPWFTLGMISGAVVSAILYPYVMGMR
jgi:hypothetical protein